MGSIQDDIENGSFNPLDQDSWALESMQDYLYTEQDTAGTHLFMLSASVAGEVMELPAGYVGFAAGIESRSEKAWSVPGSLTSQGRANDPKVEPTVGSFDLNEVFVEVAVSLLADKFLAEQVDLSAAVRAFDYSTFGSDTTWKQGLTWKMNHEIMLRSVASTAFRAPTVSDTFMKIRILPVDYVSRRTRPS